MTTIPRKKPATPARPAPVVLTHEFNGKQWTFYFGINEMIEIEIEQGKGILAILSGFQENLSVTLIRSILTAGLRDNEGNSADLAVGQLFLEEVGLKPIAENIAKQAARVFDA